MTAARNESKPDSPPVKRKEGKGNEMKAKMTYFVLSIGSILVLCGCYSSARHIASVRPDLVKPDATLAARYRLERIVLKKSAFSRKVEGGYASVRNRKEYDNMMNEDKKSGPNGTHAADTKRLFESLRNALYRDYPSVFSDTADATSVAVVVDWATEYKKLPDYASIFSGWFWPEAAEQETIYRLFMIENPGGRSDDELWKMYLATHGKYPRPFECGAAVRTSEVWETWLLPIGFIPCPGESDFPKTCCFMRSGKDSLVNNPSDKIQSRKCFEDMVFEPKVDGDVLAAAVMRIVNRKHRAAEAVKMMNGGVK